MLDPDLEKVAARDLAPGDELALAEEMPQPSGWSVATVEMAEFLGLLAADGYVNREGREDLLHEQRPDAPLACGFAVVAALPGRLTGMDGHIGMERRCDGRAGRSHRWRAAAPWLREQLYTASDLKQVPPLILNASSEIQQAFIDGYYAGDGLKKETEPRSRPTARSSPRGSAGCTTSPGSPPRSTSSSAEAAAYYQLNLASAVTVGAKGGICRKNPAEVREIAPALVPDDAWTFDIETESEQVLRGRRPRGDLQLPPPGPGVRHAQDHLARGGDQERPGEGAAAGQPRRRTRLGLCQGLRRGDVADAPAGHSRGLRDRHRAGALGARMLRGGLRRGRAGRLRAVRRDRPRLRAAGRGRSPDRRPRQGRARPRLEARHELRGADPPDDPLRPRARSGAEAMAVPLFDTSDAAGAAARASCGRRSSGCSTPSATSSAPR